MMALRAPADRQVAEAVRARLRLGRGRRRIYLFYGLLMALVGYGTLPNARVIGDALGDTSSSHDIGLTIAIVALVVSQTANTQTRPRPLPPP